MDTLTVRRIRLENILGIAELEIELGTLTLLEGKNGRGKTSVIEAVLALLGGGDTSDLLHNGAEAGEIFAELSDGTWFRRRVTIDGKNALTAGHPDRGRLTAPAKYLSTLLDGVALNPVPFLSTSDEAERTQLFLKAMPLKVTPDEVAVALVGVKLDDEARSAVRAHATAGGHALEVIDRIARVLYDERTGVNRIQKEKTAAAADLRVALPEAMPDADALEQRRSAILSELGDIDGAITKGRRALTEKRDAEKAAAEAELEATIAAARARRDERVQAANDTATTEATELIDGVREKRDALSAERAQIDEQLTHVATLSAVLARAKENETAAETAKRASQEITAAMARLDALKSTKAADLPIKGVEIKDGRVIVNGVPFPRVNKAEQVKVALRLAILRSGERPVKLIVADGLEALDSEARDALVKNAPEFGVQIIGSRVTDDAELQVRSIGGAA